MRSCTRTEEYDDYESYDTKPSQDVDSKGCAQK